LCLRQSEESDQQRHEAAFDQKRTASPSPKRSGGYVRQCFLNGVIAVLLASPMTG
jgi:hypothetical protein